MLALGLIGASAMSAQATSLSPKETVVCSSLNACVDIIRRHDATEFDYDVLEAEFKRFGSSGRAALFKLLNTKSGHADIANLLSNLGSLSTNERLEIKKRWSLERAETYLPLLRDGHPLTRDLLLLTLGSKNPDLREKARLSLVELSENVESQSLSHNLTQPLLSALSLDPIIEAAPYIARLNPGKNVKGFADLLDSGEAELVSASYAALYRQNPALAFNSLLAEMNQLTSPEQSQAIGDMLLSRHAGREDGFYLKFAHDISGDKTRSVPARASGLHAILVGSEQPIPELTPARIEALLFLVRTQPFVTQDQYLSNLVKSESAGALKLIWDVAMDEKWINRDSISEAFIGTEAHDKVVRDLIQADDFRSFAHGVKRSKPVHQRLLRDMINHPITSIKTLARQSLKLDPTSSAAPPCLISRFDSDDRLKQMPFFDTAWMKTQNRSRAKLDRKFLTSAHPSQTGWLAGYDFQIKGSTSIHLGGALIHFDNKTGDFKQIGDFSGPVAILPNRALKLGEATNQFWIIDRWGGDQADLSTYSVDISEKYPVIKHLGALPPLAERFSVAPNGDLLMYVNVEKQAPIRMSRQGNISLACRPVRSMNEAPAPN